VQKRFWHNAQLLRLFAAFSIVHIHQENGLRTIGASVAHLELLRVGTDAFLVLAGFLAAYVTMTSDRPASQYLWGRAIRIVPLFWIATLGAFLFKNFLMGASSQATPVQLGKSLLFVPYGRFPVLYPTWSLTIIMLFSVMIAVGLAIYRAKGVAVGCALVMLLWLIGQMADFKHPALYLYTSPMLVNFTLGALLAYAAITLDRSDREYGTAGYRLVGVLLIVTATILVIARPVYWPEAPRWLSLGFVSCAIVAGALLLDLAGWSVRSDFINRLTDLTYGIYLFHFFWNVVLEKVVQKVGGSVALILFIATPLPVLGLAYLANRLVEVPLTKFLLRRKPWFGLIDAIRRGRGIGTEPHPSPQ
jgi:peptidoglycan/LPS O-acetylase OafA/YrhL